MSSVDTLGVCPDCRTPIPRHRALIEYESGGERAVYAECPDCQTVAHPE